MEKRERGKVKGERGCEQDESVITSITNTPWPLTLSRCQMAILAMRYFHSRLPNVHHGWLGGQASGLPTLEHIILPIKEDTGVVGQPSYERHGTFQDSTGEPPLKQFNPHAAIHWQLPDHMLLLCICHDQRLRFDARDKFLHSECFPDAVPTVWHGTNVHLLLSAPGLSGLSKITGLEN